MQQLEQHIKEINGKHYTITPFVGTKGFKYLGRLTKYATPLVGALAQQGEDVDLPAIIQNLFFEGTDEFVSLILELVSDVHRDGNSSFLSLFGQGCGLYEHHWPVCDEEYPILSDIGSFLRFCLTIFYKDYFDIGG